MKVPSNIAAWLIDADNGFIYEASDAFATLLGYSSVEEVKGRMIGDLLEPSELDRLGSARPEPKWGDAGDWKFLTRDGGVTQLSLRFHGTELDGRPAYFVFAYAVHEYQVPIVH